VGEPISILQSIPKDGSVTREVSFTMSESESTGQWRFYSVTDISNQTAETNEGNNVSTLVSGQFNFSTKDISGTFAATTIPSQFVQGQKFSKSPTITYTYRNASDFALGRSTSMTVRAFLRPAGSTDAASNIALTSARSESLSNMAPGAERTRTHGGPRPPFRRCCGIPGRRSRGQALAGRRPPLGRREARAHGQRGLHALPLVD
jgi:hypothetical protein